MRGLATLPPRYPGVFSGQRQGWQTPKRTSGSALLLCSGHALLGDLGVDPCLVNLC